MKAEETALRTIVEVPKRTNPMQKTHRFVLLGSCFAQYMGERFQKEGMDAVCNPLGAAYNPASIRIQVRIALESEELRVKSEEYDLQLGSVSNSNSSLSTLHSSLFTLHSSLFQYDGKWRCWWANTLLSDTDERRFRQTIQDTFSRLGEALRNADFLFITLGTNVCYRLKENGMIVTNCHKVPDRNFEEVTLDTEACTQTLHGLMELLAKECPRLHVVFTVSPYRYRKYGFHGSQLAKAALLLAVDKICKRFPEKASYFPAYEIMLDELRDYSFYADDMIHPAPAAVDHIWNRLWNK